MLFIYFHHRYHHFHTCQLEIVDQYPEMVDSELKRYDEAVCKFFGVNRKHPDVSCKAS